MRDLDDLLDDGFAAYARESARPSDVDVLLRRGAGRRRRSQARVVGSAVLAVAVIVVLGVVGLDRGTENEPEPAPSPTPPGSVKLKDLTPEQIVQHPDATLENLAVSEGDPDVRASVWGLCGDQRCRRERTVVAVTQDAFETASYAEVERSDGWVGLGAMPGGDFSVQPRRKAFLLSSNGDLSEVERTSRVGPVSDDETFSMAWYEPTAIDSESGTAHPINVPESTNGMLEQSDGRLVGFTGIGDDTSAVWSDDGGLTWDTEQLATAPVALPHVIESQNSETIAILEGADGASLLPVIAFHVSRDGGETWERITAPKPSGETGYLDWAIVRPDGSLLIQFESWSDDRGGKPSKRSRGPYESDGTDWSTLTPVSPGVPGPDDGAYRPLHSVTGDGDDMALYISEGARAYVSTDGGSTWEETPAR